MKMQIAAVVMKSTKHVLAAVTRVGNPDGKLTIEQLIGDALPIYDSKTRELRGTIGKENFEVKIVEGDEGVLLAPQSNMVEEENGDLVFKPLGQFADSFTPTEIQPTQITAKIPGAIDKDTTFYIQLEKKDSNDPPITIEERIPSGEESSTFVKKTITKDDYNVIILIAGYVPKTAEETVS